MAMSVAEEFAEDGFIGKAERGKITKLIYIAKLISLVHLIQRLISVKVVTLQTLNLNPKNETETQSYDELIT